MGDDAMTANVCDREERLATFDELQQAFEGAAEEAGLDGDEDVVEMIRSLRKERTSAFQGL